MKPAEDTQAHLTPILCLLPARQMGAWSKFEDTKTEALGTLLAKCVG